MSASQRVLADSFFLLKILQTLSSMKYKVKRQFAPETPVEWLEFRPTLVPSILVSRLWADEGTSILWGNYPHLLAMLHMQPERKQYYANKVRKIFLMSPPIESAISLEYLKDLQWPLLESLEMEVDFARHGAQIASMLSPSVMHLELSGYQSGGAVYFDDVTMSTLLSRCTSLESIRFGPGPVDNEDYLPSTVLEEHICSTPSITAIALHTLRFTDTTPLFISLATRPGLSSLEIDLDPGPAIPLLYHPPEPIFSALSSLSIMLYPEAALVLLPHLHSLQRLQINICRAPDEPPQASDIYILNAIVATLSDISNLHSLKVGVGALSEGFPSLGHPLELSGTALRSMSSSCPLLTDIAIFAAEPGAIDGTQVKPSDFEAFCAGLPDLRSLSIQFHPPSATQLSATLISSLRHCPLLTKFGLGIILNLDQLPPDSPTFPNLLELGFTPPEFLPHGEPTEDEEAYIRSFAAALESCFPNLEVLEAWGEDLSESYVDPYENTLATVWEFLMGEVQDLWDEDTETDDGDEYEVEYGEISPLRDVFRGEDGALKV